MSELPDMYANLRRSRDLYLSPKKGAAFMLDREIAGKCKVVQRCTIVECMEIVNALRIQAATEFGVDSDAWKQMYKASMELIDYYDKHNE